MVSDKKEGNGYDLYCMTVAGKGTRETSGPVSVFYRPNKGV